MERFWAWVAVAAFVLLFWIVVFRWGVPWLYRVIYDIGQVL